MRNNPDYLQGYKEGIEIGRRRAAFSLAVEQAVDEIEEEATAGDGCECDHFGCFMADLGRRQKVLVDEMTL